MNNRYSITLFVIVLAFVVSCGDKDNHTKDETSSPESIKISIGKKEVDLRFGFNAINQENTVRKWKQLNTDSYFFIGDMKNEVLLYPSQVKTDSEGSIYVLDSGDNSVKKFNSEGKYVKSFGKTGRGPGEFT